MKEAELNTNNLKDPPIVRKIDRFINGILHLSILVLFVIIARRVLGDSQIAFFISIVIGWILSAVVMTFIKRSALGFVFLLLITAPAFALAFVFLLM